MTLKSDAKFEEKLTCGLENDMRNLANFHQSTWKISNLNLNWPQILQRSYVSWQWRMMQNWKRNWLIISKLTWGTWLIFTQALEHLKHFLFKKHLLTKVCNVWAKNVQRSYVWCKIWTKIDLYFQKWHEEFDKFSQAEK